MSLLAHCASGDTDDTSTASRPGWATKLHGIAQRGQSKLFFNNPRAASHSSCGCTSSSSIRRNWNGPSFCCATAAGARTALGGRICTGAGRPAIALNSVFSILSVTQWSCSKACLIRTDFLCQTPVLYVIAHPNTIQCNIFTRLTYRALGILPNKWVCFVRSSDRFAARKCWPFLHNLPHTLWVHLCNFLIYTLKKLHLFVATARNSCYKC